MPSLAASTWITFALLAVSVLARWLRGPSWAVVLGLAVAVGYPSHVLFGSAALWLAIYALACGLYARADHTQNPALAAAAKWLGLTGIVLLALGLSLHILPGFRNVQVLKAIILSPGSAPYEQWLNFDKTAAGLILLGICYPGVLRTRKEFSQALAKAATPALATIVILIGLAFALGYLRFAPKYTSVFWLWAAVNLLSTCMAEETFFRGFIQAQLRVRLERVQFGAAISIVVSAFLFGLAHFAGGWRYVALAFVAGVGYATVYERTRSVEMSILAHFSLNAVHFLFFTYPYWVG